MYITATLLKDYLSCPQKAAYRLAGEEQEANAYFVRGIAVHETIENQAITSFEEAKPKFYTKFANLVTQRKPEFPFRTTFDKMVKESNRMLDNYYNIIDSSQPPIQEVELFFRVQVGDIEFAGKIDQIRDGAVYDWKTATKELDPFTIAADYQFTLYGLAYKELFGEYPKHIYYGHLYEGRLYDLERKQEDYDYLYEVANQVAFAIENEIFPRNYDKYGCLYCPFRHLCFNNEQVRY